MEKDAQWYTDDDDGFGSLDEAEVFFECPYCGVEISVLLDLSVRRQTVIEDCEVCCQPIEISYYVGEQTLESLDVRTQDDV